MAQHHPAEPNDALNKSGIDRGNGPGQSAHHIAGSDESSWFSMNFWAHREDGLSPVEKSVEKVTDLFSWLPGEGPGKVAFHMGFAVGFCESLGEMVHGLYDAPRLPMLAVAYALRRQADRWNIPKEAAQGLVVSLDSSILVMRPQYAYASPEEEKQAYEQLRSLIEEVRRLTDAKHRSKLWEQLKAAGHEKLNKAIADWHKFVQYTESGDSRKMYQAGIMEGRVVGEVIIDILLLISLIGEAIRLARLAQSGVRVIAQLVSFAAEARGYPRLAQLAGDLAEAIRALEVARAAKNAARVAELEKLVQQRAKALEAEGEEGQKLLQQEMPKTVEEAKKLDAAKQKQAKAKTAAKGSGSGGGSKTSTRPAATPKPPAQTHTPGAINYTKKGDPFGENMSKRADVDPNGVYDIVAHGNEDIIEIETPKGKIIADAKMAAKQIRSTPGYAGQDIRLLSCSTGRYPDGFAAQLADELGVNVTAPDDVIWADSSGNYYVSKAQPVIDPYTGQYVIDPSTGLVEIESVQPPTGKFVTFP